MGAAHTYSLNACHERPSIEKPMIPRVWFDRFEGRHSIPIPAVTFRMWVRWAVGPGSLALAVALLGCGAQEATGGGEPRDWAEPDPPAEIGEVLLPAIITAQVPGDSDDPAIWIDLANPAQSLILGTDKADPNGGVYVFGLDGRIDRDRTIMGLRRPNNVDVAYGLQLGGRSVDIAVATERSTVRLRVFSLPAMKPIDGGGIPVFDGDPDRAPMGVALYQRPGDGEIFAFVSGKTGPREDYVWQYRLHDDGSGRVRAEKVREFGKFSGRGEIEAIAVDNALGYVYYSDERAGIRKYHADPTAGNQELAFFGTSGFARDREGIAIYTREDGTGYILVSDQQAGRLLVFPREGVGDDPHNHPVLAAIPVLAREVDGIEVTSHPLGPTFPQGLVVMMSADRTFHYYRWQDVEAWLTAAGVDSSRSTDR
jgi:3-phytase